MASGTCPTRGGTCPGCWARRGRRSATRSSASSPRRCWPPTASSGRLPTQPWRSGHPAASRCPQTPDAAVRESPCLSTTRRELLSRPLVLTAEGCRVYAPDHLLGGLHRNGAGGDLGAQPVHQRLHIGRGDGVSVAA